MAPMSVADGVGEADDEGLELAEKVDRKRHLEIIERLKNSLKLVPGTF